METNLINNKTLTVFISIVMVLSFGCIEVYEPEPQIDMSSDTRTIDGYDRHIEINAIELIVHGFNNNVTVINNDIEKIVVSGVNNTVYYPETGSPIIEDDGVDNRILAYHTENDLEPQIDISSDTKTIDGVDRHIEINAIELIVHGIDNNITVINNDIEKIVVGGIDNTVYYPETASPIIKDYGIGNRILTYHT